MGERRCIINAASGLNCCVFFEWSHRPVSWVLVVECIIFRVGRLIVYDHCNREYFKLVCYSFRHSLYLLIYHIFLRQKRASLQYRKLCETGEFVNEGMHRKISEGWYIA